MTPPPKHNDWLFEQLKDAEFTAEFLNAASEDEDPQTYLTAVRKVVEAHGGTAAIENILSISIVARERNLIFLSPDPALEIDWRAVDAAPMADMPDQGSPELSLREMRRLRLGWFDAYNKTADTDAWEGLQPDLGSEESKWDKK